MAKIETTLSAAQVAIAEALFAQTYAVTVGKRSGNGVSRAIPFADFPAASVLAIVTYGVQRKFNDAIGGSDTTQEEKLATIAEMIEAFKRGEVGRARAAGRSAMESEIISIMRGLYKAQVTAEVYKAESVADDFDDTLFALFGEQPDDAQAAIRAAAEESLAAKAKAKAAKAGLSLTMSIKK